MKNKSITIGLPLCVAAICLTSLAMWAYPIAGPGVQKLYPRFVRQFYAAGDQQFGPRLPGADSQPNIVAQPVDIRGQFKKFDTPAPPQGEESWPNFRGEYFDNVYRGEAKLARSFPKAGPKKLWSIDLGEGYAGPAVRNGRVYLLDYDEKLRADMLRCFRLDDGRELWRRWYKSYVKRQHGMSRTVPAVSDEFIVTIGPKCHVMCCSIDGEFRWGLDLVEKYGTEVPQWYAAQCPLIDNGLAIIAPGGRTLMIAVDCETGEIVWETPNPKNWQMTHSSILPVSFAGRMIYIYAASGGLVGVEADSGKVLFTCDEWQVKIANIPVPLDLGEGKLFLSGGYGAGSMLVQLKDEGDKIQAVVEKRFPPSVFGTEQQSPVFFDGHIYGVLPKAGASRGQMTCLAADGTVKWRSGPADRFDLGSYMVADGLIFALNDDGVLTLAEATPQAFRRLARAKVLPGHESWGPMALAAGKLLVRDLTKLVCLDMRATTEEKETTDE